MGRRERAALALVGLLAGAIGLSACGANPEQLAQQACVHVHRSIAEWRESNATGTTPARATSLRNEANRELRDATPLAAQATSGDGSWNALQTTLIESTTVDEGHLVPSLEAQCANADTNININVNPASPGG